MATQSTLILTLTLIATAACISEINTLRFNEANNNTAYAHSEILTSGGALDRVYVVRKQVS